jgi:hypothetical protein
MLGPSVLWTFIWVAWITQGSLSAGLLYPSSVQRTGKRAADPSGEQIIITASASALEHGIFSCECCTLNTSPTLARSALSVGSTDVVLNLSATDQN